MTMTPRLRKFTLTAHVTSSVGWLGAVAGFLVLAVEGLTSQDARLVRAAYLSMEVTGWYVIVPLSVASLLTGLIQALGTTWGLFQHYWVLAKFLLAMLLTSLLPMHLRLTSYLASAPATMAESSAGLPGLRIQLAADAGAALLALLVATTFSVYKPRGVSPYGQRKQREKRVGPGRGPATSTPRWVWVFGIIALVVLFVFRYLTVGSNGGLGGHTP